MTGPARSPEPAGSEPARASGAGGAPAARDRDPLDRDPRDRDPRDRDPRGRPRNDRPRDGLGRPLPRGAAGAARIPDDLVLPPAESLARADELMATGRPFHAHEVLEASWKSAPPAERDFWQGLAQLAVGLTHAHRGNARGAVTLLRRGAARLRPYAAANPHGVAVAAVTEGAESLASRIEQAGPAAALGSGFRLLVKPAPE